MIEGPPGGIRSGGGPMFPHGQSERDGRKGKGERREWKEKRGEMRSGRDFGG